MSVYADSLGRTPAMAIAVTVGVCLLLNLVLLVRSHWHGPSVVVQDLHQAATLRLIHADDDYAKAIARRFVHEYFNWSWQGQVRAKQRAAFLCDEPMATLVVSAGVGKAHYYAQLLAASTADPDTATVTLSDPVRMRFIVELDFAVREWESFVASTYRMHAQIALAENPNPEERGFLLQVSNYVFTPLGLPVVVPEPEAADEAAEWAKLAALGKLYDRQHHLAELAGMRLTEAAAVKQAADDDAADAAAEPDATPATPVTPATPEQEDPADDTSPATSSTTAPSSPATDAASAPAPAAPASIPPVPASAPAPAAVKDPTP